MNIRPANTSDIPSLYKICLQTADAGRDATALIRHANMVGDYYAIPYLNFEPDVCRVAEQDNQVVGYIVGVTDTKPFNDWLNERWLPQMRKRYPLKTIAKGDLEQMVLSQIHSKADLSRFLEPYSSHLHINLLPEAQGHGFGKQLIQAFAEAVKAKGSTGIHLGVSSDNPRAIQFYYQQGFHMINAFDDALFFGLNL